MTYSTNLVKFCNAKLRALYRHLINHTNLGGHAFFVVRFPVDMFRSKITARWLARFQKDEDPWLWHVDVAKVKTATSRFHLTISLCELGSSHSVYPLKSTKEVQ